MRIEPDRPAGGPRLTGFGADGGFKVDGTTWPGGVLLTVAEARGWSPPPLATLDMADLAFALDPLPEFLLLGTGRAQAAPPAALVRAIEAAGAGVEAMDSRAAARLWGVLRGEGRAIAAALYPLT